METHPCARRMAGYSIAMAATLAAPAAVQAALLVTLDTLSVEHAAAAMSCVLAAALVAFPALVRGLLGAGH